MSQYPVTTRDKSWLTEVLEHDPEFYAERRKEPGYEFSNDRDFDSTDNSASGIYDGS